MGKHRRKSKNQRHSLPLGVLVGFGKEKQDTSVRITNKGKPNRFNRQLNAARRFTEEVGGPVAETEEEYDTSYPDRVVARIRFLKGGNSSA